MGPEGADRSGGSMGWWLEWERDGRRLRLPIDRPLRIGRDPNSDVCLPEATVSRRHAVVSIVAGRPCVDASMSRNGILVGGARVGRAVLSSGQTFQIGDSVLGVLARAPTSNGRAADEATASYAGFWIRLAAFMVDLVIVAGVALLLSMLIPGAIRETGFTTCSPLSPTLPTSPISCTRHVFGHSYSPTFVAAVAAVAICYLSGLWWRRGATIGQSVLGLRVVRADDGGPIGGSAAVLRGLGYGASFAVIYVGFLWVAFEPRKRGWHDILAGTVVVRRTPAEAIWRRFWPAGRSGSR